VTRIKAVRRNDPCVTLEGKKKGFEKILPMQKKDFLGIFKAMEGLGVTIRLLDPPLHEFVPQDEESQKRNGKRNGQKP
jgi:pyruvate,orthophosphate dikinase